MGGEITNVRKFGFSRINWTIKNYFAATCTQSWVIDSPIFTVNGQNTTQWRLFLQPNYTGKNPTTVCASLVKEESNSSQEPIWVTWKLFFPFEIGRKEDVVESDFQSKSSLVIEMCDADELEKILKCSADDTLIIRSEIFVSRKYSQASQRSSDVGLKSLSQDFTVLYRLDTKCDLNFRIGGSGGFPAKAHKAILYARNEVLKKAIESDEFEVKLPGLDIDAIKSVFGYLYTGNLDYVLRKPSSSILECVKYFGIQEIEEYYEPDEFELCSEFGMTEYKFECVIPVEKIANSNVIISSPNIRNDFNPSERIPGLEFSPTRISGNRDFIAIFIEGVEECFSNNSYVELSVKDSEGNRHHLRRKKSLPVRIIFGRFLSRTILKDIAFTSDGNLHILCNFYIPIQGSRKLLTKHIPSDVCIDFEKHYKIFSDQITTLFESGIYSDITLISKDEKFPVHTNILKVRSHVFRKLIESKKFTGNVKTLNISWMKMKSNVLRAVLYYIYSGRLMIYESDDILDIYKAAEIFRILPLQSTCSKILQDNVESLNTKEALKVAEKVKDYKLISLIKKTIARRAFDWIHRVDHIYI